MSRAHAALPTTPMSEMNVSTAACSPGSSGSGSRARTQNGWMTGISSGRHSWTVRTSSGLMVENCAKNDFDGSIDSGSGSPLGPGTCQSSPASLTWNDASSVKIGPPDWLAVTRRVVKERPSRVRSTLSWSGSPGRPGLMKYA